MKLPIASNKFLQEYEKVKKPQAEVILAEIEKNP
jgi:hypothetical protein